MNVVRILKGQEDLTVELNGEEVRTIAYDDPECGRLEDLDERINALVELLRAAGNEIQLEIIEL